MRIRNVGRGIGWLCLLLSWVAVADAAPRPREFWQGIVDRNFAVPAGESAAALLEELTPLLASPDPVLRDTYAYGIAERWIHFDRKLTPEQIWTLATRWQANLRQGIGERNTDTVFGRSFSALCLSLVAAADLRAPFLTADQFSTLLQSSVDYLLNERDLRGYSVETGWMHSTAHTADLLKFLARNPHFARAGQTLMLGAVAAKLEAVDTVYTHGEPERLAQAILSIVRRSDYDHAAFDAWLKRLAMRADKLWAKAPQIDPAQFASVQNMKQLLQALVVLTSTVDSTPGVEHARRGALDLLKAL